MTNPTETTQPTEVPNTIQEANAVPNQTQQNTSPVEQAKPEIKIEMTGDDTQSKKHKLLMILVPLLAITILAGTVVAYTMLNNSTSETPENAPNTVESTAVAETKENEQEQQAEITPKQTETDSSGIENDSVIRATDMELNTDEGNLDDIKKSFENYNVEQIDLEIQSSQF